MVEGDGDLHVLVLRVGVAVPQQHDLVVMGEVVVRDGDRGRAVDGVDEPVPAAGQRAVVDPDVGPPEYRHPVTVRQRPPAVVLWGVPHVRVSSLLAVVDVEAVNYDVRHVLDRDAGASRDVDARSSAVDRLERVHHKLLLELDHHVPGEDDPQRLVPDHGVPQGARLGVHGVVPGVGDHVGLTVPAADGVLPEPDRTVSKPLAVLLPVGVAPPAVVDGVPGAAGEESQVSPGGIRNAPAI